MKLQNKKTGEIGWLYCDHISVPKKMTVFSEDKDLSAPHWDYTTLAELNADWKDYEEPKGIQCIYYVNHFDAAKIDGVIVGFETKEEAKKALEKLKAWKRLKDSGFVFCGEGDCLDTIKFDYGPAGYNNQDFKLLFGGEE